MPGEVGFHVTPEQLVQHADSVEKGGVTQRLQNPGVEFRDIQTPPTVP